jgi:hypothetical protein
VKAQEKSELEINKTLISNSKMKALTNRDIPAETSTPAVNFNQWEM